MLVKKKKIIYDNISKFKIKTSKLERIFIDKIFAVEFYYERKMYDDVSKYLYDISIMINLIKYMRKEEQYRLGGISEVKEIVDFKYMKLDFNNRLISSFNKMQKIYVLDEESIITIDEIY